MEMVQSNQWVAPTFHGAIDYYNSKPPLNIWLIALSIKAFGHNLWALRLTSVLAAWLSVLTLLLWARAHFGPAVALLASLVVSTSYGFLYLHAGRSANPDALLTLLILLTVVVLSATRRHPSARVWLGPLAAGVFMLKGMAVLMPLAMILAAEIVAVRPQRRRWTSLSVAGLLFLPPVLAWGVARWQVDRWQFFERMVGYDFVAGTLTALEGHGGSPFYYLNILQMYQYEWLIAAAVALLVLWTQWRTVGAVPRVPRGPAWILVGIWAGVTLLVPTVMQTKLPWYVNPFYPVFALGVGWLLASALAAPAQYRSGFTARHVAATALLLALAVTEGRLVWYSYHYRDMSRSVQGVLLAEADPMIGQRVFGIGWSRADWFVAKALARAEPVHLSDLDAFWRESRAGDYLVSRDALQDVRLSTVQSNSRSYLHRRQQ
jgi:4-amino-4-deoxy-L-arabinose transferase-like glycosyltransferase